VLPCAVDFHCGPDSLPSPAGAVADDDDDSVTTPSNLQHRELTAFQQVHFLVLCASLVLTLLAGCVSLRAQSNWKKPALFGVGFVGLGAMLIRRNRLTGKGLSQSAMEARVFAQGSVLLALTAAGVYHIVKGTVASAAALIARCSKKWSLCRRQPHVNKRNSRLLKKITLSLRAAPSALQ
jgi:hypothetical protein